MKAKALFTAALLLAALTVGQTAWATSKTVTYTFTVAQTQAYNTNSWTLTFTPSSNGFNHSTGAKTATISNITSTTGFTVQLDDGLQLTYSQDEGRLTFSGSTAFFLNWPSDGGNSRFTVRCTADYYILHVKLSTANGDALSGTGSPVPTSNGPLDVDVDIDKYAQYTANVSSVLTFGSITLTYGDPREYAITFNDAVDGQNGVTNTNPTSYNVATNTFQINAPSRTGYTLSETTYTDGQHPNATAVNLNMTPLLIQRGEAATRKAITFNATWTANTYTLRLHHNDGTGGYDDVAMTYDVAQKLPALSRTGYDLAGWNAEADGTGTAYAKGQSVTNLTAEQGAVVDLYAQWSNPGGSCGPSATWLYDHATRTLTIGGSGATSDYSSADQPWANYKGYIETVSISDGITSIGTYVFKNCTALTTVTGGSGLTSVKHTAFNNTPWKTAAQASTTVVYLGHVAYCGESVSGDITIADGTVCIAQYAFQSNNSITSVTIPSSVTIIGLQAFYSCAALATVNILAATPPTLGSNAFGLLTITLSRTFNVRTAAYKTSDGWADIYNHTGTYDGYTGTALRVVSTLALPDGVTAAAAAADKVTAYGTDYYAEGTSITLSGATPGGTTGGITCDSNYIVTYNDGTDHADRYAVDDLGNASFTMPAADATVSTETVTSAVAYIDADGTEQTCNSFTVVQGSNTDQTLGSGSNSQPAWYVVPAGNITVNGKLWFNDPDVHLILCDGATLTVTYDDTSTDDALSSPNGALSIYGQAQQSGALTVTCPKGYAISSIGGDLTINGGTVSAAGIEGIDVSGGNIIINGGTVTATSTIDSHGIYASPYNYGVGGDITINGGTVKATGSYGIFGRNVTINGGTVTATSTDNVSCSGIYGNTITLGWTNAADRITSSSYTLNIVVKTGQTLYDGDIPYSGTIDRTAIAGKTLAPYPGAGSGASAVTARKAAFAGVERYWATFYDPSIRYALPAGAQAFYMKDDHALYRIGDGSVIPANCAVVIMAEASALTNSTATSGLILLTTTETAAPAVSGNILQGKNVATPVSSLGLQTGQKVYVLGASGGTVGFFQFSGTDVPAGKAYYIE